MLIYAYIESFLADDHSDQIHCKYKHSLKHNIVRVLFTCTWLDQVDFRSSSIKVIVESNLLLVFRICLGINSTSINEKHLHEYDRHQYLGFSISSVRFSCGYMHIVSLHSTLKR